MARLDRSTDDLKATAEVPSSFQTRLEHSQPCFYGIDHERAVVRYHDGRGCVPVCQACAYWREGVSHVPGHAEDCPEKEKT